MEESRGQVWLRAALLVGVAYFLIGRAFAIPADHVRVWRLAAWLLSGAAYALHIWYELARLRNSPRLTALHAGLAVAIGAVLLALAGMLHSMSTASAIRPTWLLALLVLPAVTAVPAFLVALVTATFLGRISRRADADSRADTHPNTEMVG